MTKKAAQKLRKKRYVKLFVLGLFSLTFLVSTLGVAVYSKGLVGALSAESTEPYIDDSFLIFSYTIVDDLNVPNPKIDNSYLVVVDFYTNKVLKYNSGITDYSNLDKELANLFAIPIERSVVVTSKVDSDISNLFWSGNAIELALKFNKYDYAGQYQTDFSTKELVELLRFFGELPQERIIEKDITSSYTNDPTLIDEEIKDVTFNSALGTSNYSIAVLNGAEVGGLATHIARTIKNLGGRVVAIQNASTTYAKTLVVTDIEPDPAIQILLQALGVDIVTKSADMVGLEPVFERADITVVLGVDRANLL